MKLAHLALVVALSAVTAFAVVKATGPTDSVAAQKQETAFERVMRTGTLRCGYVVMPPQLVKDPNTGAFSGISYDIIENATKILGLKVEWKEEVNFITVAEGLKNGRYDAFCFTSYRWLPSTRVMDYSTPLFYSTTKAYVRADDMRFDETLEAANDSQTTVATLEGEASVTIRDEDFPKSTVFSLPINTDYSFVMETLPTRKADIVFSNPIMIMPYLEAHRGAIKLANQGKPVRTYSHTFAFGKNEQSLLNMFNATFDEMIANGTMDKILDKYEIVPDTFIRVKSQMSKQ